MGNEFVISKVQSALMTVLLGSSPVIVAALAVGILVGLAQALTQIQDQSLPQTFKLVIVLVTLMIFGPLIGYMVVQEATAVFEEFPTVTR